MPSNSMSTKKIFCGKTGLKDGKKGLVKGKGTFLRPEYLLKAFSCGFLVNLIYK